MEEKRKKFQGVDRSLRTCGCGSWTIEGFGSRWKSEAECEFQSLDVIGIHGLANIFIFDSEGV